jgi:hypothetical protein
LDVPKETVVGTARRRLDYGKAQQQMRTYGIMTEQLLELRARSFCSREHFYAISFHHVKSVSEWGEAEME